MKNTKGITLIALIITIIVMLILAGVTISMVVGDNGVLKQAQTAGEKQKYATAKEQVQMLTEFKTEGKDVGKIDLSKTLTNIRNLAETSAEITNADWTNGKENGNSITITFSNNETMEITSNLSENNIDQNNIELKVGDIISYGGENWVVFYDSNSEYGLQIVRTTGLDNPAMTGMSDWENGPNILNTECSKLIVNTNKEIARAVGTSPIDGTNGQNKGTDGESLSVIDGTQVQGIISLFTIDKGIITGDFCRFYDRTSEGYKEYCAAVYDGSGVDFIALYNDETDASSTIEAGEYLIFPVIKMGTGLEITGGKGTASEPYTYEYR